MTKLSEPSEAPILIGRGCREVIPERSSAAINLRRVFQPPRTVADVKQRFWALRGFI